MSVILAHVTTPELLSFGGVFLLGAVCGFAVALRVIGRRGLARDRASTGSR